MIAKKPRSKRCGGAYAVAQGCWVSLADCEMSGTATSQVG